jgi:hypothetical protein
MRSNSTARLESLAYARNSLKWVAVAGAMGETRMETFAYVPAIARPPAPVAAVP